MHFLQAITFFRAIKMVLGRHIQLLISSIEMLVMSKTEGESTGMLLLNMERAFDSA
jgi:hypothetical protein